VCVVWCGVVWCGVWCWCGLVLVCGVVWCGVVWCGVVWCGVVVCCGVVWWCVVVWCRGVVVWCYGVVVLWYGVVVWVQNLDRDELENKPNKQTNKQANEQTEKHQTAKQTTNTNKHAHAQTNEQTNEQTNDQQTTKQTNKQNIFFDSELRICKQANKRVHHLVVLYFKALHIASTTELTLQLSHIFTPGALDGFSTGTNGLPYALLGSGTQKGDHFQVELEVISRASMAYPLTCPQHMVGLWIPNGLDSNSKRIRRVLKLVKVCQPFSLCNISFANDSYCRYHTTHEKTIASDSTEENNLTYGAKASFLS
jgi:hypothetical protein